MRLVKKPTLTLTISCVLILTLYYFLTQTSKLSDPQPLDPNETIERTSNGKLSTPNPTLNKDSFLDKGSHQQYEYSTLKTNIMPQMTNETLKAALGRSSWHLFHTILARYPESPTIEEQDILKQYLKLFATVYPCGDCASHFQLLLSKYPPQVSNRVNAALWGCEIHNKVNQRLGKDIYDCSNILEDYDCGCGNDEELQSMGVKVNELNQEELQDKKLLDVEEDHLKFEINNEGKQGG
ncbi:hypothetical protein WICPIJ_003767 [Wickerhamomyces pijperi]|uniref:Sulfhydryl oxidase n=1 Tax=Wickerhamomyces pijperi TaxID=599730 RepID=A0A9P8TMR3_WICPI|nr:hypothetical protein WICPIJ_003767 [Wickerhamomyces pijperi]